jgi:hypothetical protein
LLRHRFGVNYTPSRNWYYCWNDFEPDAIARDFDAIAALGADHLRLMTIWPWFQPNPHVVSPAHLRRLEQVMRLAAERGLDVQVAAFTGFLSGYNFRPPYCEKEPFYASPIFWKHQELFIRELGALLRECPNFLGFDIGNEINCCWQAPTAEGDAWMNRMLSLMEEVCPEQVHVNGVDNQPWFVEFTFSPQNLARRQEIVPLHCYIFFTGAMKYGGAFDPPCLRLIAGMAALARAYGGDPRKPVWVQEYGACDEWMAAADMPRFLEQTTLAAIAEGVSWFTWWDSHDLDPKFYFPTTLEYNLGLLSREQKVKDTGRAFSAVAKQYRGQPVEIPQRLLPPPPPERNMETVWQWLLEWLKSGG